MAIMVAILIISAIFIGALAEASETFVCGTSRVIDADGNVYATVQIGNQCWLAENLKVGRRIAGASAQSDNGIIEKYCHSNDENICAREGGLYQWNEAMQYVTTPGAQGICPDGWHIPTDSEQHILEDYLKAADSSCDARRNGVWDCVPAGSHLFYFLPNSDNSSGFSAPLAGYRDPDGTFYHRGTNAYFWSSSEGAAGEAWKRYLDSGSSAIGRCDSDKTNAFSVRCLKD